MSAENGRWAINTLELSRFAELFRASDPKPDNVLYAAPVTVLGIGNVILRDEGFGVRVLEYLRAHYEFPEEVRLVDGGTLGIELTQYLTGTEKLLVLDSIKSGQAAGTMFRIENEAVMEHFQEKLSAHEVGIQDVLAGLTVTGRKIPSIVVLGAEPYVLEAGVELSPEMEALVPEVARMAIAELRAFGVAVIGREGADVPDYTIVAEESVRRTMEEKLRGE